MSAARPLNLVRGTLDLLVLKALSFGPRHGYAVSQWIDEATAGALLVEEGSLYPGSEPTRALPGEHVGNGGLIIHSLLPPFQDNHTKQE